MRDGDPIAGEDDGLILFDGVCVLCSGWVRFVVRHDRAKRFRFLPIQSARGRALAVRLGIDPDRPATNAVILEGRVWFRSSAALKVLGALPATRWTRIGWLAPRPLRDLVYRPIARHRTGCSGGRRPAWFRRPRTARGSCHEDRSGDWRGRRVRLASGGGSGA